MATRPKLTAKTKLVDGVRYNIADNTVAEASTIGQQKKIKEKGLEVGKTPTVISDSSIRENVIPGIKADARQMLAEPQGTAAQPQETPQGEQPQGTDEYSQLYSSIMGTTPTEDPYYDTELKLLEDMKKTSDLQTRSYIDSLNQVYNTRRAEQQAVTGAQRAGAEQMLFRGGGMRSGSGSNLLSGIERAGIRELSTLDAEEQQLKASALAAQTEQDYKLLGDKLDLMKEKRAEKLQTVSSMWEAIVEERKETQKGIDDVMADAAANGAPKEVLDAISGSQSKIDAISNAGEYLQTGEYAEYKRAAIQAGQVPVSPNVYFAKTWSYAPTGGSSSNSIGGYTGDFEATIGLAAGNMGSVYSQKAMKDQLESAIAAGDYESAAQAIKMATASGLSGENKTKFENAQVDAGLLSDLADAIKAYKDAGGDMNLAKSVALDAGKSLGVLVGDAPYAALAVQLDSMFQQYRQNMTGAAFGAQESAEYQRVRPKKGGGFDLNEATIEGASNYANNYVKNSVRAKTGEGGVHILERAQMGIPGSNLIQEEASAEELVLSRASTDPEIEQAIMPLINEGIPFSEIVEALPEYFK